MAARHRVFNLGRTYLSDILYDPVRDLNYKQAKLHK